MEFVRSNSPPEHSVLFLGDFNMSPHRPGKAWKAYEPRRYASRGDMLARTEAFEGKNEVTRQQRVDAIDALFALLTDEDRPST